MGNKSRTPQEQNPSRWAVQCHNEHVPSVFLLGEVCKRQYSGGVSSVSSLPPSVCEIWKACSYMIEGSLQALSCKSMLHTHRSAHLSLTLGRLPCKIHRSAYVKPAHGPMLAKVKPPAWPSSPLEGATGSALSRKNACLLCCRSGTCAPALSNQLV